MRLSTNQTYKLVLDGLNINFGKMVRAANQVSSGRRINAPSDDPTGAALVLAYERRLADIGRASDAALSGRDVADSATAVLEEVSGLLTEVRSIVIQGMNGTLDTQSRKALSDQVSLLREQLVTLANTRTGNRYLFGGSETSTRPFDEVGGKIVYFGDDTEQQVRVGQGIGIPINVPGSSLFAADTGSGAVLGGATGLALGTTANDGSGEEHVTVRHDATDLSALAPSGIVSAAGGANDTFVGSANLVIDTAAGTATLGDGTPVPIPDPTSDDYDDFVVSNGLGGELHLDLSLWNGADVAGPVSASASVSIDGSNFVAVDFTETDLRLANPATGSVLHVDTSALGRAGDELVNFAGDVDVFAVLDGIAADLEDSASFDSSEIVDRLGMRLGELDRHHDNVLAGLGILGSRSARLGDAASRLSAIELQVTSQLSDVRDADLSEVVLDLQRSQQILQVSQAVGSRLIQSSLLDFLR
ncbi:MAG: flagellar hook-associated protein FlgL [Planctomycetota bacterium]